MVVSEPVTIMEYIKEGILSAVIKVASSGESPKYVAVTLPFTKPRSALKLLAKTNINAAEIIEFCVLNKKERNPLALIPEVMLLISSTICH